MPSRVTALLLTLAAGTALADRGALTLDVGGGGTVLLLPPPYTTAAKQLPTTLAVGRLGVRYAVSDEFELSIMGNYEPRVAAFHSGVTLDTSAEGFSGPDAGRGAFEGTLAHSIERLGLAAGARWIWGSVFRIHLGVDVGWSQRSYGQFDHMETLAAGTRSHGLRIPAYTTSNWMLAPITGIEWVFSDKWSVSLVPRVEFLVGREPTVGLSLPILLSHSWYL